MTLRSNQTSQTLEFHKTGDEDERVSEQVRKLPKVQVHRTLAQMFLPAIQPIALS